VFFRAPIDPAPWLDCVCFRQRTQPQADPNRFGPATCPSQQRRKVASPSPSLTTKETILDLMIAIPVGILAAYLVLRLLSFAYMKWQAYRDDRRDSMLGSSLLAETLMPHFEASRHHQSDPTRHNLPLQPRPKR
jgi:hypothetical protein